MFALIQMVGPLPFVVQIRQPREVKTAGSDEDGRGGDDDSLRARLFQIVRPVLNAVRPVCRRGFPSAALRPCCNPTLEGHPTNPPTASPASKPRPRRRCRATIRSTPASLNRRARRLAGEIELAKVSFMRTGSTRRFFLGGFFCAGRNANRPPRPRRRVPAHFPARPAALRENPVTLFCLATRK